MANKEYDITDEKKYTDLNVVAFVNMYHGLLDLRNKVEKRGEELSLKDKERIRDETEMYTNQLPKNIACMFVERPFQIQEDILKKLEDI